MSTPFCRVGLEGGHGTHLFFEFGVEHRLVVAALFSIGHHPDAQVKVVVRELGTACGPFPSAPLLHLDVRVRTALVAVIVGWRWRVSAGRAVRGAGFRFWFRECMAGFRSRGDGCDFDLAVARELVFFLLFSSRVSVSVGAVLVLLLLASSLLLLPGFLLLAQDALDAAVDVVGVGGVLAVMFLP